jgi:hypothetical protein
MLNIENGLESIINNDGDKDRNHQWEQKWNLVYWIETLEKIDCKILGVSNFHWILTCDVLSASNEYYACMTPWSEAFLRSWHFLTYSKNSPDFVEPEILLPQSQGPATFPYPEPD